MPTVSIVTLGCKLNQSDSEAIARRLAGEAVAVVDRPVKGADAFVINTCSVTHVADRKARHLVRLARRLSPGAQVILTGCYAETAPTGMSEIIGADAVYKNDGKSAIPDLILERLAARGDPTAGCPTPVRGGGLRTRAFIKIQEGCNELCAFCIVPYTRGREVSVPVDEVVRQVQEREEEGVLEVVLTGTQLGNYGRDLGWQETGPGPLLEALLRHTSVPRIRLSSLQAQDFSERLIELWQDRRLCPHFHLPLQSGSDPVLTGMRRRYTANRFRSAVALIRGRVPHVAITTDVIAGFPGEAYHDFEATYRLCEELEFADMHCFPYSKRPHTGAALMDGHLSPAIRRGRLERLLGLAKDSSARFRTRFLGCTLDVLWEEQKDGLWEGLTGNYMRLYAGADDDLQNRILPARLVELLGSGVRANLMEQPTA
jgi:threonylcarbamoyladenosine tRNA methylthiotransferase MtaB